MWLAFRGESGRVTMLRKRLTSLSHAARVLFTLPCLWTGFCWFASCIPMHGCVYWIIVGSWASGTRISVIFRDGGSVLAYRTYDQAGHGLSIGSQQGPDIWVLFVLCSVYPIYLLYVGYPFYRRRRRRKLGLCLKCGYDLRGSEERCPECGQEF